MEEHGGPEWHWRDEILCSSGEKVGMIEDHTDVARGLSEWLENGRIAKDKRIGSFKRCSLRSDSLLVIEFILVFRPSSGNGHHFAELTIHWELMSYLWYLFKSHHQIVWPAFVLIDNIYIEQQRSFWSSGEQISYEDSTLRRPAPSSFCYLLYEAMAAMSLRFGENRHVASYNNTRLLTSLLERLHPAPAPLFLKSSIFKYLIVVFSAPFRVFLFTILLFS